MHLLTKTLRKTLPEWSSSEFVIDPMVHAKFVFPDFGWSWYVIEFDGEDLFYGLVVGFEQQLGYFSLKELEAIRGKQGKPIERDRHFEPCTLFQLEAELAR